MHAYAIPQQTKLRAGIWSSNKRMFNTFTMLCTFIKFSILQILWIHGFWDSARYSGFWLYHSCRYTIVVVQKLLSYILAGIGKSSIRHSFSTSFIVSSPFDIIVNFQADCQHETRLLWCESYSIGTSACGTGLGGDGNVVVRSGLKEILANSVPLATIHLLIDINSGCSVWVRNINRYTCTPWWQLRPPHR